MRLLMAVSRSGHSSFDVDVVFRGPSIAFEGGDKTM
jgi:hypothetical protein